MNLYVAPPTSRLNIRNLALILRKIFDLKDEEYFPIAEFLELGLPQIIKSFELEIVLPEEMPYEYGLTFPEKKVIRLREDVYENAISGVGRDRFTVAHEIGHLLLHKPASLSLARNQFEKKIPAYKNPEWQANTFAAELLAPPHIIRGMSAKEIALRCGVSVQAAGIQLRNI